MFSLISGYCSHRFGRKCVLMSVSVSFTLSWLLIAYAQTVEFIYAGRLMSGFSAGMCTVAVPAYVVEISTVKIRGLLAAGFQVAFSLGVLVMTACGIVLRWSWLAIIGAVVVTSGSCLLYFMPESPPWLIKNNKPEEAMKGIKFLKGKNHNAEEEFDEIEAVLVLEPIGGFSFRELLSPGLFKPLLITFGLMFYQSFSGSPAIMSYTVKIFKEQKNFMDPNVASTVVALVQMLSTIVSSLLMDKAGRKFLYIISGISMTVSLIILGIHSYLTQKCGVVNVPYWDWIPLICFMIYISSYALGFGPIPYVVIPELVPTHTRSFVMAVGCASASFLGFLVIKSFVMMRIAIGFYGLYWLYSAVTLCGFLTYWIFIPETKGRSIQEINELFTRS